MPDPADRTADIEAVRRRTLDALDALTGLAAHLALPAPPEALPAARRALADDRYRVLVLGEAKRGKSTLVNALIGRPVVPTAVEVATSQVFLVRHAPEEAYRLRFEDESVRPIAAADLPRYGSQILADAQGLPRLDQIIRWIEVDVPIRFLPPNVALLDTPGLGSLYAAHAPITRRFLPHADAVIFVLDSDRPIGQDELGYVAEALAVTRDLFFVQTKTDQHRAAHWRSVRDRSQDLLAERFGDRLPDPRVWPIGSQLLLRAAATGDDDFLAASRHKDFEDALRAFLFRVVGASRVRVTLLAAEAYHAAGRAVLDGRLASLACGPDRDRADLRRLAEERKHRFDADWGPDSPLRRDLLDALRRATEDGRTRFAATLRPDGPLARAQAATIAAIASTDEADALAQTLPTDVAAAAENAWLDISSGVRRRYLDLLQPFATDAQSLSWILAVDRPDVRAEFHLPPGPGDDWLKRLRVDRGGDEWAGSLARDLFPVLLAFGLVSVPVAAAGVAVAAVWSVARGWTLNRRARLQAAQDELRTHLDDTLGHLRTHFLAAPIHSRPSQVDGYLDRLERAVAEAVDALASRKSAEAQTELVRLAETSALDDAHRAAEADDLRAHLDDWDDRVRTLRSVASHVAALERSFAAPALAPAPTPPEGPR